MSLRSIGIASVSLLLACGSPAQPAAPLVMPATTITGKVPNSLREPSAAIAQRFAVASPPNVRVYVDMEAIGKSDIVRAVITEVEKAAGTGLDAGQRSCLTGMLAGARELAIGVNADERGTMLVLLRFDPTKLDVAQCMQTAQVPVYDAGRPVEGGHTAAIDGDVLILGEAPAVARALKRDGSSGLEGMGLASGQVATFQASLPPRAEGHGSLEMTSERFRLAASVKLGSEEEATRIERMVGGAAARADMLPPSAIALAKSIHVARAGSQLDVDFTLAEPVADQARDLGTAAALAVFAVRKYLINAKVAEARNVVGTIARDLVAYYESETTKGTRRKLVAFPPVPKTVPRGVAYQSSPADWKAWAPLRFEMSEPQRFQYEVKLDKTGKHAQVIARGDLNGDGKTSTFRLLVDVPPGKDAGLQVSPHIEETDPDE
jgi:hypothetical protein